MDGYLFQAFIYLCAAVCAVPLAKRLGLGSVLGYLIAGVLIGPVIGLVGSETEALQHFAEFGVVMMLFLVGLELEPRLLWQLRHRLIGLGGLQVVLTTGALFLGGLAFSLPWQTALAIGLVLALSSTAIVLQTLAEKGLSQTEGGRASFSVLLFQDIAVIPILALLPLLAIASHSSDAGGDHHGGGAAWLSALPGWAHGLILLAAVAFIVLAGLYLTRPVFRYIAQSGLREIFTAAALLLIIGIALLMTWVGLSPALGTFLAGVVLANSEYRHELEADIEPFKGLLLGLFFITVGAGIDFGILSSNAVLVIGLTVGVIAIKALVLWGLARIFGLSGSDKLLLMLGLAQAGEFGFVLLSFTVQNGVIGGAISKILALVVALSMMITPLLFIAYERIAARSSGSADDREPDDIPEAGSVIIAGHGRFGQIVNRLLVANGIETVVLDHRSALVDGLRKFGVHAFYGDATRPDLLHVAGLESARAFVVAIDDHERAVELVEFVRRTRPDIKIIARAHDRQHVFRLHRAGASDVVRETFDSAVRAGRYALVSLGMHPFRAERVTRAYVRHDRASVKKLADHWDPDVSVFENKPYIDLARERNAMTDQIMQALDEGGGLESQTGWSRPGESDSQDAQGTSQ